MSLFIALDNTKLLQNALPQEISIFSYDTVFTASPSVDIYAEYICGTVLFPPASRRDFVAVDQLFYFSIFRHTF